jgi:outer membrane protein
MQFRFLIIALCSAATALAQVASFPRPSYFRETFKRTITKVELQAPVKLSDFVVPAADGKKLELSLRSFLDLVMANNTDIAVSRLTLDVAQNAITRAFGPFDPIATGRFLATQSKTPASDQLQGATTLATVQQPSTFGYSQLLSSGTSFSVGFNTLKSVSNSGFQTFNPTITSNMSVSFAQPLIKNRGVYINRLPITSARSRLRLTEYGFRDSVLQLIMNAENAYWDLVQARDFLAVQEKALALADAALKRSDLELKLGAMSPLDIFNPQQNFATAEIGVVQARFQLQQREDALRKQIGADLDPTIRTLPIVLTETADVPADEPKLDTEAQVQIALANRPDLKASIQALDVDDLQIHISKNALLPDLSLLGLYTTQGRGGNFYQRGVLPDGSSELIGVIPGGFPDALSQMWGFGFPIYQFGLQLRLPIRNRSAAADLSDAMVAKKRDALAVRNVEQNARLNVVQAISQLESAKESVRLSLVALDFGRKYLEAEQKKYELGTSTIFFVLQANQALVNAESAVVQNKITYKRSMLNLWRQTGELLDRRGVAIQ